MMDLLLEPGQLTALLSSRGLDVSARSPLAGSPLLRPSALLQPVAEAAELPEALRTLADPTMVIAGLRGARRLEPWPLFICRRGGGPAVLLAPEAGGSARLRFPYSLPALVDWLAGPFRRFAAPEIGCPEIPPLTATGLAVVLAIVDMFRHRYAELDPDWREMELITFTSPELMERVADASSLMNGLARLGGPDAETLSLETVESLLYLFCNEGYLEMDISLSTPLFTMTEAFTGTALSLAWWDLSLSLESMLGSSGEPVRLIQGLALWRFLPGKDQRISMKSISGEELQAEIGAMVSSAEAANPSLCSNCGTGGRLGSKFCASCGRPV